MAQEIPFLNKFIGAPEASSGTIIEPIPEIKTDFKLFKQGIIFGDYIFYQNPGYIGVLKIVDENNLYLGYVLWDPENSDTAPYTGVRQNHEGCAILLKKFTPYTVQHSNEKALVTYPTEQDGIEIPLPTNMTQIMEYILNPGRQLFTAISQTYNFLGGFIVNSTTFILNSTGAAIYSVYNLTSTALNTTVVYVYTTVEQAKKIITTTSQKVYW
jgi:hypothetical protein